MSEKYGVVVGICPDCREPVTRLENHAFQYRKRWVAVHIGCQPKEPEIAPQSEDE